MQALQKSHVKQGLRLSCRKQEDKCTECSRTALATLAFSVWRTKHYTRFVKVVSNFVKTVVLTLLAVGLTF